MCPYECVSAGVKGPMRPLILNIDTLVTELRPLIPYPPLREVRREETREVKGRKGEMKYGGEQEDRR